VSIFAMTVTKIRSLSFWLEPNSHRIRIAGDREGKKPKPHPNQHEMELNFSLAVVLGAVCDAQELFQLIFSIHFAVHKLICHNPERKVIPLC
jgi:hypothetical protein